MKAVRERRNKRKAGLAHEKLQEEADGAFGAAYRNFRDSGKKSDYPWHKPVSFIELLAKLRKEADDRHASAREDLVARFKQMRRQTPNLFGNEHEDEEKPAETGPDPEVQVSQRPRAPGSVPAAVQHKASSANAGLQGPTTGPPNGKLVISWRVQSRFSPRHIVCYHYRYHFKQQERCSSLLRPSGNDTVPGPAISFTIRQPRGPPEPGQSSTFVSRGFNMQQHRTAVQPIASPHPGSPSIAESPGGGGNTPQSTRNTRNERGRGSSRGIAPESVREGSSSGWASRGTSTGTGAGAGKSSENWRSRDAQLASSSSIKATATGRSAETNSEQAMARALPADATKTFNDMSFFGGGLGKGGSGAIVL